MLTFVIKRIAMSIPVLIGITALLFIMLNVIPGDPIALLMKEHASADVINRVRAQMHLDDPLITRYFRFLFAALQGDLGVSIKLNRDVTTLILNAFPSTLILSVAVYVATRSKRFLAPDSSASSACSFPTM